MTSPVAQIVVNMRADGDPDAFVGWCAATQDLMAFRNALRRVAPEQWRGVHLRLAESLGGHEPDGAGSSPGNAADRDRRGRAAARVLKREMLAQFDAARTVRGPGAWRRKEKHPEPIGFP
jgi:hypothetical protein